MKLSLPVTLCVVFVTLTLVDAGRKNVKSREGKRQRLQEGDNSRCRYFRKAQVSLCDAKTNTRSVTFPLKKGVNCPPTQVFHQPCSQSDEANSKKVNGVRGCKYKRGAPWSECGPGVMSKKKEMTLKPGQPASCPLVRTKTVPCRSRKNKTGKMKKKKRGNGKGKACKYQKGAWSECDPLSNTRTRQLTLKKGDESVCLPKKTITKKCRKPCKYTKGPWLPCNESTNEKMRQLTLKKGDPSICNATMTITKPCRRRDAFTAAKTSPCKFSKGEWSECDEGTNLKTRTDQLIKGDASKCEATRTISKKCGKEEECKYDVGNWSGCDDTTKERSRMKTLVEGDPEKCQPEIKISRPCFKPNGEASCFLGNWGDYGPCQNGVMMKHRPVIAGGVPCERKAVKAKPCS
ncbi:uncharacterized protein [Littorina saxatilis]|uniref:uncharacterized protein isoform X2 n=1 Tax=Littorina saxatilis TaxID=31220 RepID=UPI0038B44DAA